MLKKLLIVFPILLIIISLNGTRAKAQIDPNFDPNFIISDEEMLNWSSLTLSEIQAFLESKNSYLATYQTINAYGTLKTAAEIIYEAAVANYDCKDVEIDETTTEAERQLKCQRITTINPKVLLVLLQKESSLIENPNPIERLLDQATGYGCPDSGGCNPRFAGFGKQVNSAALQFLAYLQTPLRYPYKAGVAYIFNNPYGTISQDTLMVVPTNQATAALYNYTPHVFNGNYNFWRIYNRYFPESVNHRLARYPDGSLLRAAGEPGVWLIQRGQKRPFLSWSSLTSRYNPNRILVVDKIELEAYPKGAPIKYPNYSLLRSPMGNLYLIVGDQKRLFVNQEVFRSFGFHPDEIIDASLQDLNYYQDGEAITADSSYLTGALLQDPQSGGVFYVHDKYKAPLIDRVFLTTKFKNEIVKKATIEELAKYEKISPVLFDDGELLKSSTVSTVYLISNGQKRAFTTGQVFESLGYQWANIIEVSPQLLSLYPFGDLITDQHN